MTIKEILFGSDRLTKRQAQVRELAMYPVAGAFTAVANAVSFILMDLIITKTFSVSIFGLSFDLFVILKQFVSWIATVITAYTTNRIFVFRSHGNFLIELAGFAAARLSTFLVIEVGIFSLMVMCLEHFFMVPTTHVLATVGSLNITCLYLIKFLNNLILVVANYVMSKWFVFKSSSGKPKAKQNTQVQEEEIEE